MPPTPTLDANAVCNLTEADGSCHAVAVQAYEERVFPAFDDRPPPALVIVELTGPDGLRVPGAAQLELPNGELGELELVYRWPLGEHSCYYVAVAPGKLAPR